MTTIQDPSNPVNNHILIIDDNPAIHADFRKVLCPVDSQLADELDADEASLFGDSSGASRALKFQIDSAYQGQEGLEKVRAATLAGQPYAVAFVDVRMPPGWDGIETITHIWKEFPDLQVVICTAYSDYSWDEIAKAVGNTDHVLVLKKPFDNVEVMQMATALSKKWQLTQIANRQMADLDALVNQRTAELREANARLTGEVAERAAAQDALLISEERFSKAFHGCPVPMAIQRTTGPGFLDANERFLELLGGPREAVLMGNVDFWVDDTTAGRINGELAAHHAVRDLAASIRTASGETREVLVAAENLELGNSPYRLLILQDITERARLETELRQAQKMEAVGRLAAGVAHDFNNILTVILGNTSLQLRNPRLDEKLSASLHQVVRAAERATALTRQLLAYSRKQMIQRRALALNGMIEQTVAMLRRLLGEHIAIDLQLGPDLPPVFADASNVDQVVMNLAINARDAMRDGGRLTIVTSLKEIDEGTRGLHPGVTARRFVCMSVKDTGHGMDASTLGRIFEPFFTTKGPELGTGLGLSTVWGLVQSQGGRIDVRSSPGKGTTFTIRVSLARASSVAAERRPSEAPAALRILVIDDEPATRDVLPQMLAGHTVETAVGGAEGLERFRERPHDVVISDWSMPGLSGLEVAAEVKRRSAATVVVLMTGWEVRGTPAATDPHVDLLLAKPIMMRELERIVAEAARLHRQRLRAATAS